LFYQSQLAIPQNISSFSSYGPVIGHAVSADLVRWAHLPVALWNDLPFRNLAVFTGSATLVYNQPFVIFPGICGYAAYKDCGTYFTARPANASDPLLAQWRTLRVIANHTMDDPTSAWLTADGSEWRFIGATGAVYSSPAQGPDGDGFSGSAPWTLSNTSIFRPPTYNASDGGISCGDLFPLPRACDGPGCSGGGAPAPSHVYKLLIHGPTGAWGDYWWLGNYSDEPSVTGGAWAPLDFSSAQPCDGAPGLSAASAGKSFFDPLRAERVQWAAVFGAGKGAMTLPRDLRWHGGLQRLVAAPVPATAALRAPTPLFSMPGDAPLTLLSGAPPLWLGDWAPGVGNASELLASFALPPRGSPGNSTFGAAVLVGRSGAGTNSSLPILIALDAQQWTAELLVGGVVESDFMPGYDLPGGDYRVSSVNYTDPRLCEQSCAADGKKCWGYVYVTRPPTAGACCLKGAAHGDPVPCAACTAGVLRGGGGAVGAQRIPIPLLPSDTELALRVLTDRTLVEVFAGRASTTLAVEAQWAGASAGAAGAQLFFQGSGAPGEAMEVRGARVWQMTSAFVSVAQALEAAGRQVGAQRGQGAQAAAQHS
jgi:hypothetical protein